MKKFLIIGLLMFLSCDYVKDVSKELKGEWHEEINKNFHGIGIGNQYTDFRHEYTTPEGAKVQSTKPTPQEALAWIDEGIKNQIVRHSRQYPNWTEYTQVSNYDVAIIDPPVDPNTGKVCVNQDGSPCMYVKGWQSAGTMLGGHDLWEKLDVRPVLVVVHQVDQNWQYKDYFMKSVWHESEHVREWMNQHKEPTGIFYHWATAGDRHPHID